jgi:hypothetical protein
MLQASFLFNSSNTSSGTMTLGLTQPLTKKGVAENVSGEQTTAGA